MKLPLSKIESATAGKKEVRLMLQHLLLSVEAKTLTATNGHIIAIVPVEPEEGDTSGYITVEALKAARKSKQGPRVNGSLEIVEGASFPRPTEEQDGKFPDASKVMPAKPDREPDLCIDAKLLLQLAEALNDPAARISTGLEMWFPDNYGSAIYCEGTAEGHGAIMPMRK